MSRPIIFNLNKNKVLQTNKFSLEKDLQKIVEKNMKEIFNLRFLATEYSFWDEEGNGRIDTLALDESNRPTIIEYKLNSNKNVINQTLYYMNWVNKHKGDFELLVQDKLGEDVRKSIEWEPRGICIAEQFNKYDNGAIKQMNADIQLIQYYCYGEEEKFIGFENINKIVIKEEQNQFISSYENNKERKHQYEEYKDIYPQLNENLKKLVDEIISKIQEIGDDVSVNILSRYATFKKITIFGSLVLQKNSVLLLIKSKYDKRMEKFKNIENIENKGHWGIGNTRIRLNDIDDLDSIWHFVVESYENN